MESQDKKPPTLRVSWAAGTSAPASSPVPGSSSSPTPNSELHDPFSDNNSAGISDRSRPDARGGPEPGRTKSPSPSLRHSYKYNPRLVLVNSGSVARDHLANERTVLAYIRTSLALSSMGVALVQLLTVTEHDVLVRKFARPLGAIGILLGLFTLMIGICRYFMVQSALTQGYFPVARASLFSIGLTLALLVCIVLSILVAIRE